MITFSRGLKVAIVVVFVVPWFLAGLFWGLKNETINLLEEVIHDLEIAHAQLAVYEKVSGYPVMFEWATKEAYTDKWRRVVLKVDQGPVNICLNCHKEVI